MKNGSTEWVYRPGLCASRPIQVHVTDIQSINLILLFQNFSSKLPKPKSTMSIVLTMQRKQKEGCSRNNYPRIFSNSTALLPLSFSQKIRKTKRLANIK